MIARGSGRVEGRVHRYLSRATWTAVVAGLLTVGLAPAATARPEYMRFPIPNSQPLYITAGPDGNLWFTDYGQIAIGRITTSGAITEFPIPQGSQPEGITLGPDGNLWFTMY